MSDRNDVHTPMSDANDAPESLEQMKAFMALRGLQPNTVYTFALCVRGFLAHAGKAPTAIKTADVEGFLLEAPGKPTVGPKGTFRRSATSHENVR
jgi:hypothetical protein